MKKTFLYLVLILAAWGPLSAQSADEKAVQATIEQLFDAMRAADASGVQNTFVESAMLQSAFFNSDGSTELSKSISAAEFATGIAKSKAGDLDERIHSYRIDIQPPLATAWTEYSFYYQGAFSHCGVNAFQLFQTEAGWKITHITDTREHHDCSDQQVNEMIDGWHRAAATADADAFFGAMTKGAVYLGTDETERWLRDELRSWSASAWERDVAWDFTPRDRHLEFYPGGKLVWWDELLDTWMGVCRGSGVAVLTEDGWKIKHYNLAVTIPNDKIDKFRKLVKAPKRRP